MYQMVPFLFYKEILLNYLTRDCFNKMLYFMPVSIVGLIQYISVDYHLSNISRGVIDSRNIIYFASLIGFFLFTTVRVLEIRKWR